MTTPADHRTEGRIVITVIVTGNGNRQSLVHVAHILVIQRVRRVSEKLSDIRGEVKEIGWGNQIRSYVMQPYTLVKDHRTNAETGNVDAVLDGSIDLFINAYLKWINSSEKEAE